MKLAISGKGGVGKTLLAATLARTMADAGYSVTAIDADPDANLALSLGFPDSGKIVPISEMKELIQERTGTQPGSNSPYFKINPRVDDIPEKYSVKHDGVRLLVMGQPKAGGAGCYCPENAVLAALMAHLLLAPDEMVIMDMAAGIEHLSRGTPGRWTAHYRSGAGARQHRDRQRIRSLAHDLGIQSISVVGKSKTPPKALHPSSLPDMDIWASSLMRDSLSDMRNTPG
jgi:CO dehydrogenase maturation factor